jgi:hypothetical protein
MEQHDFEIEIAKDGTVKVHISGAKGKVCLDYAAFLTSVVGKQESVELTSEYYEPETGVQVSPQLRVGQGKDE